MAQNVRAARMDDTDALGIIHVAAWQAAYRGEFPDEYLDALRPEVRAQIWKNMLVANDPSSRLLVVEDDDTVFGFAALGAAANPAGYGELFAMNISPDRWRRGFGRRLLLGVVEGLVELGFADAVLWTGTENHPAQGLYETEGWSRDGAARVEDVLGATVNEVRYYRRLG